DYLNEPRCMVHKYLAKGKIHRAGLNSISHDADTLGGSSGSPIFYQGTHELIGIHHAGMAKSGSSPAMNFGIPMHRIAQYLVDNHPEINIYESIDIEEPVDPNDDVIEPGDDGVDPGDDVIEPGDDIVEPVDDIIDNCI